MMANPEGSFIWYELMTPDSAGSAAFYNAVVGWTTDPSDNTAAGGMDPQGAAFALVGAKGN